MEEGSFSDVFDVLVEGEGLIKQDTKVTDMGGSEHSGAIDGEGEVMGGFDERFGTNDDDFSFVRVEFEEVGLKPGFYFIDAVGEGRVSGKSDGFGGDVELNVIGKAVELESMTADYLTKGENVQDEEERAKN